MNSKTLRRLAADHRTLHKELPPNFFLSPDATEADELTQLDILLAGPQHTPYSAGVFKLHLTIPPTYPTAPPTANFRTQIFHPNVDPSTGGVCVETLKRDWDSKLTLRDVLVTISCLLIQPNPDSALNADAGALIQSDFAAFAKRARMMTSIHAKVPKSLAAAVKEAQERGQEIREEQMVQRIGDEAESSKQAEARPRQRRTAARQRGTVARSRASENSPSDTPAAPARPIISKRPFVFQAGNDDVFGTGVSRHAAAIPSRVDDNESEDMYGENQENDEARSPMKAHTPVASTPRRPPGTPVPLGELTLDDSLDDSSEVEEEYPPSPKKSPQKHRQQTLPEDGETSFEILPDREEAESSPAAATRPPALTPPQQTPFQTPGSTMSLEHGTASPSKSPQKSRPHLHPMPRHCGLFGAASTKRPTTSVAGGISKQKTPSPSERKKQEQKKRAAMETKLWKLCGEDVGRWNRGDFGGFFEMKAARW